MGEIPDWKYKPLNRSVREGEESGFAESDYATLIVSADGGEKKKMEENNKKGESKGSGRAEAGASSKEGTTTGANIGMKSKQDGGDGSKRLVSHRAKNGSQYCGMANWKCHTTPLVMFYGCIPYRRDLSVPLWTMDFQDEIARHTQDYLFPFFKSNLRSTLLLVCLGCNS